MARDLFTTLNRGELVYCSDDENNLRKFDLRGEGLCYQTADIHKWVSAEADRILQTVPPMCRGKPALVHTKTQREAAEGQARQHEDCPQKGTFRPLQHGPAFCQMIREYRIIFKELGQSWKADMLAIRLWEIHTGQRKGQKHIRGKGNRRIYLEVLGILLNAPDKKRLASLLFSWTMAKACIVNQILLDPVLEDFFNIRTGVDGRGEVLHALLFSDQHWLPGTDSQDAEDDAGDEKTSIKQYKGPNIGMRMGASGYNRDPICQKLDDASKKWPTVGDTRYRTGITKEMIEAHRTQLDELFKEPFNGQVKTFEQHLNDAYQQSERDLGTHYVCFYTPHELRARRLEDTEAVGATKNDFQARPKDMPIVPQPIIILNS